MQKGLGVVVLILAVAIIGILVGGGWYYHQNFKVLPLPSSPTQRACTLEAKICDDGSSVGREGPNCEFRACPASSSSSELKSYKNLYFSLKYPINFNLTENTNSVNFEDSLTGTIINISWDDTDLSSACSLLDDKKHNGSPNANCTKLNGLTALSLGSEIPPYPMGPITYAYYLTNKKMLFNLELVGTDTTLKDEVLNSFKFN